MATIDETPRDLVIADTPTSSEYIRRVEPSRVERILDIRMAATIQIKTEHTYHLEQANMLAARIRRASIIRIEAEAAYRHWIPTVSYCLSITTLTIK